MGDNFENFLNEQKAKLASDKANYVPYMEMKTKEDYINTEKENTEPASGPSPYKQNKDGFGLILQLGEEYDKKKQQLKQELREDYIRYVSEKEHLIADKPGPESQLGSLPIKERKSAKDKLRDERNKEYILFLKGQEGARKTRNSSFGTPQARDSDPICSKPPLPPSDNAAEQDQARALTPERLLSSRKDAATLTEPRSRVYQRPRRRRRWVESPETSEGRLRKHIDSYSSEEEPELEEDEEELDQLYKRRSRHRREPVQTDRREKRTAHERRGVDTQAVNEEVHQEENRRTLSASFNPNLQDLEKTAERSKSASNQNMAEFATGLLIGAAEGGEAAQRRKERYRQELLEQMAEQQKNKRREKELELRVAATGAVDPEKQPDRIKQFGAVNREYESRKRDTPYRPGIGLNALSDSDRRSREEKPSLDETAPPERPRAAFQSPPLGYNAALSLQAAAGDAGLGTGAGLGVSEVSPINDDFHRRLSGTLGDIMAPRIRSVPLPLAPTLADTYRTPYDDAYYYYGARNPLDPSLTYYGRPVHGGQQFPSVAPGGPQLLQQPPSGAFKQVNSQQGIGPPGEGSGLYSTERPKQTKDSVLNYQDALKQQIQERQERKRREREERERYDAKLEAEMKAYEPWGRGGGGAPLRDDRGNLISDLRHMHRSNEEAYVNPEYRDRRAVTSMSKGEDRIPSTHRLSDFSAAQPSPHARGNVFAELPTPQQLHEQDKYRDYLRQQIEEKRRKDAEEKERLRLETEREERRLAEQRARIQKEYEEEQEKKKRKEMEQIAKNEELVRQAEERRREAERKKKEEDERATEALRKQYERDRQTRLEEIHREPSPPIPTLQRKLGQQRSPRPLSVESRRSAASLAARSRSAPHSPPVPARRNQLRATEEQQGVISELSALRKQLRSEQRRVEDQLLQSDRDDVITPVYHKHRERPPADVFDMARLRIQVPARRPPSKTKAPVNIQNILDFNQLKYRDSESREELRHAFPDPPSDDHSLDIQQQALLREQQRKISNLRTARGADYFDLSSPVKQHHHHHHHQLRENSAGDPGRGSLLEADSAFIDPSGDVYTEPPPPEQRARQNSARDRRRAARKTDFGDDVQGPSLATELETGLDAQSLQSIDSFNVESVMERNQRRMRRLEDMSERDWRSEEVSGDEGDDFWDQPLPPHTDRRVSVDTVATEPWLRPGTSETLKRSMAGRRLSSKQPIDQDWEGPSTYHG